MKKSFAPHLGAVTLVMLAVAGCTPQSEIDQACAAHPPKLPDAPVVTDGYFIADYRVPRPALDWISGQLLTRGFSYIETEGRTVPGMGAFLRFTIGEGEEQCKSAERLLSRLQPNERLTLSDRLVQKGLKPNQCLAVQSLASPTARYRLEIFSHSPPRNSWIDGLSGRQDVRVQTMLRDMHENRALADIWSVTLSYQVTVSGSPVTGCQRREELQRLENEFLQPLAVPRKAESVAPGKAANAASAPAIERIAEDKLPAITEREVPLKVLAERAGGAAIDWRTFGQRQKYAPPPMKGASVVNTPLGWILRVAVKDVWREVPMKWLGAEKRDAFYVNQPIWVFESPRGIAVLAFWRRGKLRENYGEGYFVLAEYTREGEPLSRTHAQLPLARKSNPHYALISAPVYRSEGLAFTVTETGSLDEAQGMKPGGIKDPTHAVLREVEYLLPVGVK